MGSSLGGLGAHVSPKVPKVAYNNFLDSRAPDASHAVRKSQSHRGPRLAPEQPLRHVHAEERVARGHAVGRVGHSFSAPVLRGARVREHAQETVPHAPVDLDARAGTVSFLHNGRALGEPRGGVDPGRLLHAQGGPWPPIAVAAHGAAGSLEAPGAAERDGIPVGAAFTGVPPDVVFCVEIKEGGCQILSYC